MLLNGDKVGPYTIRDSVGQGGMATVYKAWHEGLHRFEALKVPRGAGGGEPDSAYIQRLLTEARTAAGLHHPHIVAIHGVSEPLAPIPFFAMDWVDGQDLAKMLAEKRTFSIGETIQILESVASALDYAHERGVVHRDIKPANILLGEKNGTFIPRVVDFGISRAAEDEDGEGATKLTKSGMIVGTPEYMSPEQAGSGDVVDYRTDIYSLAVVAYEMLCGGPPFTAGSGVSRLSILISHVRDVAPLFSKCPDFPRAAGEIILRALSKSPQDRPQSCGAFLAEFKAALDPADMVYVAGSGTKSAEERAAFEALRLEPVDSATLYERPSTPQGAPQTMAPQRGAPVTAMESPTGSSSVYSLRARLEAATAAATPPASKVSPPTQIAAVQPVAAPVTPPLREVLSPGEPDVSPAATVAEDPFQAPRALPVIPIKGPQPRKGSRFALLAGLGGLLIGAAVVFALSGRFTSKTMVENAAPVLVSPPLTDDQSGNEAPVASTGDDDAPPVVAPPRLRTVRQKLNRAIEFPTVTRHSDSRPLGSTYVLQRGQIGMRQVVLAVTYRGEKEVTRRVESNRVVKQPISQIVVLGTRTAAPPSPVVAAAPPTAPRPRQKIRSTYRSNFQSAPQPRTSRPRYQQRSYSSPSVRTVRPAPHVVPRPKPPVHRPHHVREAPLPP